MTGPNIVLGCDAAALGLLPDRHRTALCASVLDLVSRRVRTSVSLAACAMIDAAVMASWAVVGNEAGCADELDMAVRRWRSVASHTDLPPVLKGLHAIIEALETSAAPLVSNTIDLTVPQADAMSALGSAVEQLQDIGAIDIDDVTALNRTARELLRGSALGLDLDPILLAIALGS